VSMAVALCVMIASLGSRVEKPDGKQNRRPGHACTDGMRTGRR
jgi:hypothetical protein